MTSLNEDNSRSFHERPFDECPFDERPHASGRSPRGGGFVHAAILGTLWVAACGDGTTGPAPTPNRAPVASGAVPAQTAAVGQTATVNVAAYFSDPDGDALTYGASSSNATTAPVSMTGSVATVSAVAQGVVTITVTARDPGGLSAQLTFTVTIPNQAPVAVGAVPGQSIFVGETVALDVAAYFSDPDGDALAFSAESSDAGVAAADVAGSVVSIEAVTQGASVVTVTATDAGGMSVAQPIAVTVPNRAPEPVGTIPDQTLSVGQSFRLDISVHFDDADGDTLQFVAASSNAGVASADIDGTTMTIAAVRPGTARITVTASDPAGLPAQHVVAVTVANRAPVVVDSIPPQTVARDRTVTLAVSPFFSDPDGDTLTYAASSSRQGVATVTVTGGSVTVKGVAPGTATITVTASDPGVLTARQPFQVTVTGGPQDTPKVVLPISDLTLTVGASRTWRGADHFRDPNGDPLTYAVGSSNASVAPAVVSTTGFTVRAASPGTATITVTASDPGGLSASMSFAVTVRSETQAEVVISGVAPTVLVEGGEASITGSGFSATAAQNQVSVGGRGARVTAASPTALTIVVPRADCLPPRREELRVAVGSESDARTVGVTPESLDSEPGRYWHTYAGNGCLHMAGDASGGEYLIGVVSSSENPASLTGVTLTGTPWDASALGIEGGRVVVAAERGVAQRPGASGMEARDEGSAAMFAQGPFRSVAAFDQGPLQPRTAPPVANGLQEWPLADDTLRMRRARAHDEIMARNEALMRRLGRATRPALADARREWQVGDTLTLYAKRGGTCSTRGTVQAVVRLVGNSSIWLDDIDNPAATFTDSELANLDAFYSENVRDVHDDYFGGLSDVDNNDRFLVLMTKEVNRAENVGGWVWSGDLYPSAQCPASNQAEIFYGKVPDPRGSVGDTVTKQAALDYYPQLIAHEVTHLIQSSAGVHRGAGGGEWKDSWEWEGGASLAEQLVAYRLFGHGSGQELGWSAYTSSQEGRNWYWRAWVADMAAFFGRDWRGDGTGRITGAPEECSWVGREEEGNSGPCLGNAVYGVPSMVLRYAMDRWAEDYPGGERALLRRFTQSPRAGFASLVDVSPDKSWRPEAILTDFYVNLWLDLQPGYRASGMTTWDLHDLFRRRPSNWRLQPYTSSSPSPRLTGRRVRGGSALYFHWTPTGALRPTSIKVTSPGGGRVPDHISIWALRVS